MINIETLNNREYPETPGVRKITFDKMLEEAEIAYRNQRHRGVPLNYKLTLADKLIIALIYLREYRSMHSIAVDYSVSKK